MLFVGSEGMGGQAPKTKGIRTAQVCRGAGQRGSPETRWGTTYTPGTEMHWGAASQRQGSNRTPHHTQHTAHSTQHTAHSTHPIPHTPHTPHNTHHTPYAQSSNAQHTGTTIDDNGEWRHALCPKGAHGASSRSSDERLSPTALQPPAASPPRRPRLPPNGRTGQPPAALRLICSGPPSLP